MQSFYQNVWYGAIILAAQEPVEKDIETSLKTGKCRFILKSLDSEITRGEKLRPYTDFGGSR